MSRGSQRQRRNARLQESLQEEAKKKAENRTNRGELSVAHFKESQKIKGPRCLQHGQFRLLPAVVPTGREGIAGRAMTPEQYREMKDKGKRGERR